MLSGALPQKLQGDRFEPFGICAGKICAFQRALAIEMVTRQRPAGSLAREAFAPTA